MKTWTNIISLGNSRIELTTYNEDGEITVEAVGLSDDLRGKAIKKDAEIAAALAGTTDALLNLTRGWFLRRLAKKAGK